jgi:glycosyltransferase involved in cell wall biosynthesis
MKLVASMIVRNELDRYLELSIGHLMTFVHEIRVLDDGSTDGSYEFLLGLEKVAVLTNSGPSFFEHEGRARQMLLEWTLEAEPDYVLSIDADEFVGDPALMLKNMNRGGPVYTLQMEEVWAADNGALKIRMDGQWKPRPCPILWRAPHDLSNDHWSIPDVQLACGREPIAVRRTRFAHSGSSVYHFGWARQAEREARAERYFEHDRGRFHKDAHLQSILWPEERVLLREARWPVGLQDVRMGLSARTARR